MGMRPRAVDGSKHAVNWPIQLRAHGVRGKGQKAWSFACADSPKLPAVPSRSLADGSYDRDFSAICEEYPKPHAPSSPTL